MKKELMNKRRKNHAFNKKILISLISINKANI